MGHMITLTTAKDYIEAEMEISESTRATFGWSVHRSSHGNSALPLLNHCAGPPLTQCLLENSYVDNVMLTATSADKEMFAGMNMN
ncbi:hypothetical protein GCK32_002094, partial [Trichostrongylus colubriformis]